MLQGIVRAIRYATRLSARSPLVTAPAIHSVSGIGAKHHDLHRGKRRRRPVGKWRRCPAYSMPTYETVYNFRKCL